MKDPKPARATILVVEDEARIAEWVRRYLEGAGHEVVVVPDGEAGLDVVLRTPIDLVVLDLSLPGMDGIEVAQQLRTSSDVPIIMLTARGAHGDRVEGLETGADDYITKPFNPEELLARVKAVLRRSGSWKSSVRVGDFEVNRDEQTIRLKGSQVALTAQQFAILSVFLRSPNSVISREQLIADAFRDFDGFDRTVDVHIHRVRQLIEVDPSHPKYLRTVYGAGYRFTPEEPD